jgi:MFS transporter, CP family, cyanate transporter
MSRTLLDDLLSPAGTRRPRRARAAAHRGQSATLLGIGLVLIALNLRIGVASVGPVLTTIRDDLGLSAPAASLLTTIPVVAFGAFAFLAPAATRRLGLYRLLGLAMAALAAGIVLRLQPSMVSLFAGTVVVGAAIAIANVVMPAVIKRDFPHRIGPWMGLYSTMLFLSAAIADGLTVPLLPVVGGHWRRALALWAIPAVVAFLVWIPQLFRTPDPAGRVPAAGGRTAAAGGTAEAGEPSFRALLTDPVALALTGYMAVQCTGYYVTLTWLPTLLQDDGMTPHSAGWMLSYSAFPGIAAALASPVLARRIRPTWVPIAVSVLLYGAAYAGLAVAPLGATYLWMTLLGLGQGASISLALSYIAWRSPDAGHTAHVSTMAQGFGYLLASLGPIGIGAIHAASGSWTVPLIVLSALLVLQLIAGALASRERQVLASRVVAPPEHAGSQPTESDQPRSDDPWFEWFDEPRSDDLTSHDSASHEPTSDEPRFEDPGFDDPASHELASREPTSREPIFRELAFREPAFREPASRELATGELATGELATGEPKSEDPVSHQPASRELASDEPKSEDAIFDEPASDDLESDEPVSGDLASDDAIPDEPASDNLASDEPISEEPKSGDLISGEPGADEPSSDELVQAPWENVVSEWLSQPGNPALPRPYAPQNRATAEWEHHLG